MDGRTWVWRLKEVVQGQTGWGLDERGVGTGCEGRIYGCGLARAQGKEVIWASRVPRYWEGFMRYGWTRIAGGAYVGKRRGIEVEVFV